MADANQPIALEDRKAEGKPLVLVVDDDPTHHKLLSLVADRLGITAHMASNCAQAIEALQMFSFDVILMDYRMPDVDGCGCTRRIRAMPEVLDKIAIIGLTADLVPGNREKCLESGMNDFLGKPFTLEELHQKLSYWLQKKKE